MYICTSAGAETFRLNLKPFGKYLYAEVLTLFYIFSIAVRIINLDNVFYKLDEGAPNLASKLFLCLNFHVFMGLTNRGEDSQTKNTA